MERSLRSVFHPGLPRYRISPFIRSQKPSWPDDGRQWKLGSVLLSKLFPTLKWAINSPVWRENNVSGGLLQSRLSFRAEMEKCVRWCHLSRTQKTNKSNNLHQILNWICELVCTLLSRPHTEAPSMAVTTEWLIGDNGRHMLYTIPLLQICFHT